MRIADDITKLIGNTPLVRLNRVIDGAKATVAAKLEMWNPAQRGPIGVLDDRGRGARGKIAGHDPPRADEREHGDRPSAAAAKGYRLVLTMPETMSIERRKLLCLLGAEPADARGRGDEGRDQAR